MMKKLLGYFLISLPIILGISILIYMIIDLGWIKFIIQYFIACIIAILIFSLWILGNKLIKD